jgi:hypothetical protein
MVAIGGRSHTSEFSDYEHQERFLEHTFEPIFMYPAPPIFSMPEKCPKAIRKELKKAFTLFWSDTGSCANRLRAAAETLLTDRKVPRTRLNKEGKRERIHSMLVSRSLGGPTRAPQSICLRLSGLEMLAAILMLTN